MKDYKQVIPFWQFSGGVGQASQAKQFKATQRCWPVRSVQFILCLLKGAESNMDAKSLKLEDLVICWILHINSYLNRNQICSQNSD
jgi:large subunit ribosomal protein L17e